mmetsp:Transcript_5812/g.7774  ORF Transcript_5812/g.7774 Transcript_5812/m.7774 type:complete len:206 (+) Transcript_5812:667-1284(+)
MYRKIFYRQIIFKRKSIQDLNYKIALDLNEKEEFIRFFKTFYNLKKVFINWSNNCLNQANFDLKKYLNLKNSQRTGHYVQKKFYAKIISLKRKEKLIYYLGKILIYKNKILKEISLISVYFSLYSNRQHSSIHSNKVQYLGKLLKTNFNNAILIHGDLICISNTFVDSNKLIILSHYNNKILSTIEFENLLELLFPPKTYYILIN